MADYPVVDSTLHRTRARPASTSRVIDELREAHPFYWNTRRAGPLGAHPLRRHPRRVPGPGARSPTTRSSATDPDPAYRFLPSHLDPPMHMEYRHLLNKWFAPAAVDRMRPHLVELARGAIEPLVDAGRCDFIDTVGDQLPGRRLPRLDGPAARRRRLLRQPRAPDVRRPVRPDRRQVRRHGGVGRDRRVLARRWSPQRRRRPRDPDVDLITLPRSAHRARRAAARRGSPRHRRHAHVRQPRHDQEPARLVRATTSPRIPTTAPGSSPSPGARSPTRSRSSCAPTRSSAWPARSPRTSSSTAVR